MISSRTTSFFTAHSQSIKINNPEALEDLLFLNQNEDAAAIGAIAIGGDTFIGQCNIFKEISIIIHIRK